MSNKHIKRTDEPPDKYLPCEFQPGYWNVYKLIRENKKELTYQRVIDTSDPSRLTLCYTTLEACLKQIKELETNESK